MAIIRPGKNTIQGAEDMYALFALTIAPHVAVGG
jgi:hypothetical protein